MLFAAGFGTRMAPLTDSRPKPLIEVAGKAMLDHALDIARAAGITRIVVNVHYLGEQIIVHLEGSGVMISDERGAILETGGGLRKALALLGDGPVLTMNTDAIWRGPNVISQLLTAWEPARMDALLAVVPPENTLGHRGTGDFTLDDGGRITRGAGYVYTGAQILNPAGIETISEEAFSLNLLWDTMISAGRAYGIGYQGRWCDVGRPESIELAETMLRGGA